MHDTLSRNGKYCLSYNVRGIDVVQQLFRYRSVEQSNRSMSGNYPGIFSFLCATTVFAAVLQLQTIFGMNWKVAKISKVTSNAEYLGAMITALVSIAAFSYLVILYFRRVESAKTSRGLYVDDATGLSAYRQKFHKHYKILRHLRKTSHKSNLAGARAFSEQVKSLSSDRKRGLRGDMGQNFSLDCST